MSACKDIAGPERLSQTMRVTAVTSDRVRLEAPRAAACSSCAARQGCGTGAFTEVLGGKTVLDLPRTGDLVVGQEVSVSLPGSSFLAAAGLAYLLPPAALALSAGFGAALGWSDAMLALVCGPVFALSFWPLVRAERRGQIAGRLVIDGPGAR